MHRFGAFAAEPPNIDLSEDLLFSWQHMTNVAVYDVARGLATHGNLRFLNEIPFQSHESRLAEPTPEIIESAKQGSLFVPLPVLVERSGNASPDNHPITGSTDHYVLYDRLHKSNSQYPHDV